MSGRRVAVRMCLGDFHSLRMSVTPLAASATSAWAKAAGLSVSRYTRDHAALRPPSERPLSPRRAVDAPRLLRRLVRRPRGWWLPSDRERPIEWPLVVGRCNLHRRHDLHRGVDTRPTPTYAARSPWRSAGRSRAPICASGRTQSRDRRAGSQRKRPSQKDKP